MRVARLHSGPSLRGWALLLLLALFAAFLLRFWDLGDAPPGLYRDEAYNGLDALEVLQGRFSLYFPANNGREPAYIYLTALMIALFGRTALAVRVGAALVGTLTTALVFQLGRSWFDRRVGVLAAWIWAITLWPVHLSRIGLRPIMLVPCLAGAFWLGARAYKTNRHRAWFWAGLIYGLSFYTYLAARFTPILLLAGATYLALMHKRRRLWPGAGFFALGTGAALVPLVILFLQDPALVLGRTGQVSILNPAISGGDFWGTLWRQTGAAFGLFLWQGDTILRHNPAGRPVFDIFMVIPFLLGLFWCLRHWRRPAAAWLLLWQLVLLGPTLLAEDAPHFLRAVGLLPGIVLLPALGLSQIGSWSKLPRSRQEGTRGHHFGPVLLTLLLAGSMFVTIRDYAAYERAPDTAYMFEGAARELAQSINNEAAETVVLVDDRFWQGWPAITFLAGKADVEPFRMADGLPASPRAPATIYLWPYEAYDFSLTPPLAPAHVTVTPGALARGDLETYPYPLYVRLGITAPAPINEPIVTFEDHLQLLSAVVGQEEHMPLSVTLFWEAGAAPRANVKAFVHLLSAEGALLSQSDAFPGAGFWPTGWWQPGIVLADRHQLDFTTPLNPTNQQIVVGLYNASDLTRLTIVNSDADAWVIWPNP